MITGKRQSKTVSQMNLKYIVLQRTNDKRYASQRLLLANEVADRT